MCAVFRPAVSTATEIFSISEDQSSNKMQKKIGKKVLSGQKDDLYLSVFAKVEIFTMNCCLQPGETAHIQCS